MLTRTSYAFREARKAVEESDDLHLRKLLVVGSTSEQDLYVVARLNIEEIGELAAEEHAGGLALQGVHRIGSRCPDEVGIQKGSHLSEPRRIDRGHVPRILVLLALQERVQQAIHDRGHRVWMPGTSSWSAY